MIRRRHRTTGGKSVRGQQSLGVLTVGGYLLAGVLGVLYLNCSTSQHQTHKLAKEECDLTQAITNAFVSEDTQTIQWITGNRTLNAHSSNSVLDLYAKKCIELLQSLKDSREAKASIDAYAEEDIDTELVNFSNATIEDPELKQFFETHFDLSQFGEAFFAHAYENKKRIQTTWKKWQAYDTLDIHNCQVEVPECKFYMHPAINNTMYNANRIYRKCCVEHMRLKKTLQWTIQKMHRTGLQAWLAMGSLLAQVRHNGIFVPWDTDIDMYLGGENETVTERALMRTFPNTRPREHWFGRDPKGRAVYWVFHSPYRDPGSSHVEIWLWKKGRTKDPHQYDQFVYPLKECTFYNLKCWCPNNPEALLSIWYGEDWRTYQITGGRNTVMMTDAYNMEVVKRLVAKGIPEGRIFHTLD